ncbi:MAG: Mrp/NBP35 family ATP-binding protein [Clostridium sp.]
MSDKCSSCAQNGSCSKESTCTVMLPKHGKIKNIIGVMSGKGGVGKSTVTGILAIKLSQQGHKVGVLDADITGPSMPRFFGINNERALMEPEGEEVKFIPVESKTGIKVISLNLLIQNEEDPVIWRGPVINGVLNQMYVDTVWGELDYLLIDMPPGTGDIALTIMQNTPITGVVMVSTPQDMVTMIVKKLVTMAKKLNMNTLGVVENMSYVTCGKCDERIRVFSKKTAEEQAKYLGLELLSEMPIDLDFVENLENGTAEEYIANSNKYNELFTGVMNAMSKSVNTLK